MEGQAFFFPSELSGEKEFPSMEVSLLARKRREGGKEREGGMAGEPSMQKGKTHDKVI